MNNHVHGALQSIEKEIEKKRNKERNKNSSHNSSWLRKIDQEATCTCTHFTPIA